MANGVAAMQRKARKNPSVDPLANPRVPSSGNSHRVRAKDFHRTVNSKLNTHFAILIVFFLFGVVFLWYQMLSSQQEKMHKADAVQTIRKGVAAAHSASRIMASNKPYLIYGTAWKKEKTAKHVSDAVRSGFRFIDTACQPKHYNEAGVGEGWTEAAQELGLSRSDIFLQTKFTSVSGQDPNRVPYDVNAPLEDQVKQSLKRSLTNLRTEYLDSLVLHSPLRSMEDTMKVWRTFESFVDEGTVSKLGISNCYDYEKFTTLYQQARIKPWALQNRFYAESDFDTELRAFCKEKGINYQSFWTLTANRHALALREIQEWAREKNLTPQAHMYAFLMSMGYVTPLSGTTSKQHMAEDVAVMQRVQKGESIFENDKEMRRMAKLLGMPDM